MGVLPESRAPEPIAHRREGAPIAGPAVTAPIGVPRCYIGAELPVIYPGEVATAQLVPRDAWAAAIATGRLELGIVGWLVEPMPGWRGRWLRGRYRLWGRWLSGGPPQLEATATIGPAGPSAADGGA